MTEYRANPLEFPNLFQKVVVLTGGSTGIGAATVSLLHKHGALVVFGDVNQTRGKALAENLNSGARDANPVFFEPCDVPEYADVYGLFKVAYDKHGRVDHAIPCAGILEQGNWFDPDLTIESVTSEQTKKVLEVNLLGTLNFARVAVAFLRDGLKSQPGTDRSLTLLSSVNTFRESPGLFMYQTSKHGILGLLRSMRKIVHERDSIRVNCVCPGITDTPMTEAFIETFRQPGLASQTAEDVAKMILGISVTKGMTGKAIYIEGGTGWEFEERLYQLMPQWLGEEPTRMLRASAEHVSKGALLKK